MVIEWALINKLKVIKFIKINNFFKKEKINWYLN